MAYRLRPDRPFKAEFVSVAREQLERAVRLLEDQPDGEHAAVHDARKRLKRVRALYRLIGSDAKDFRKREDARIRTAARSISALRDATALVETAGYLATHARSPEELAALATASKALSDRRDRLAAEEHDLPEKMAVVARSCKEAIAALEELNLEPGVKKRSKRLKTVWKKQRKKALAAVEACMTHPDGQAFHRLRKQGQTYWMHLSLLRDIWPSAMRAKQNEAKRLVDLLGHEHDLSVLTALLNESPELFGNGETLALILGAIILRQQALRQEALDMCREVFAEGALEEAAIVQILWKRAAGRSGPKGLHRTER